MGILIYILPIESQAKEIFESMPVGIANQSTYDFINGEKSYSLYEVRGYQFISLETLQAMQWHIENREGMVRIMPSNGTESAKQTVVNIEPGDAYMAPNPIYCGNIRSYGLLVNDHYLIPIEVLNAVGHLKNHETTYWMEPNFQDELNLLQMNEKGITNLADHLMHVTCIHLYWNGKVYEQTKEVFLLEIQEHQDWHLAQDTKKQYITTVVEEINEWPVLEETDQFYGQQNEVIFKQYSDAIYLRQLQKVFPRCVIKAQMIYGVGDLIQKQEVEVCRSEKHYYYVVKDEKGNKYQVPYNSIRIIGEQSGATSWKVSDASIEDFATLNHIESATDYLIWVDLCRQKIYVLKKSEEKWKLEKSFVCSTGKMITPTPAGLYEVQYSIPYIGVQKGYRCKYALVFFRDYMFHSILFDKTGEYIKSGQYELGSKASHGCVRLTEKDSKWLYKHIPVKTAVWIR